MRVPSVDELVVGGATAATTLALAGAGGAFYPVSWCIGILVAAWAGLLAVLWGAAVVTRHSVALAAAVVVAALGARLTPTPQTSARARRARRARSESRPSHVRALP